MITSTISQVPNGFSFVGPQLNNPNKVRMTVLHRGDNEAAKFHFRDEVLPATTDFLVRRDERGVTCLGNDKVEIAHVEHILSALYGTNRLDCDIFLEYDDCETDLRDIGIPVSRLNSSEFTHAIMFYLPLAELRENHKSVRLSRSHIFTEDDGGTDPSFAVFSPLHKLHITTVINFETFWGQQLYSQEITPTDYAKSICWARSFHSRPFPRNGLEWDSLKSRFPAIIPSQAEAYQSMMLDFTQKDWITPPIVQTEPVRHKMLDFIGEMALFGRQLTCAVYVYKPSHKFNRDIITKVRELWRGNEL